MLKKLKNYSFGEIALLIGIVGITVFTLWYVYTANKDANKIYDSISTTTAAKGNSVKVESEPSGVKVASDNYCDSSKLKKETPFTCVVPKNVNSITLTAPVETTHENKKYTFKEWSGCSQMPSDKYTCKITLPVDESIKIIYTLATASSKAQTSASSVPSGPQAKCNGTLTNNGKSCRYVINYEQNRMPGRLSAVPIQTNPNKNIYDGLTITGECSVDDACETYEPNPKQLTGPTTKDRIDISIKKPTTITIDVPMSWDTGNSGGYYLLGQFVYNKATYANGGGGTYFDSLTAEYTLQYRL